MEVKIGKIKNVTFGKGGYQDAMIGFNFDLGSERDAWGVGDFWGYWDTEPMKGARWTVEDQKRSLGETVLRMAKLLEAAKVDDIKKLIGLPIEVMFEDRMRKGWRILTEAI